MMEKSRGKRAHSSPIRTLIYSPMGNPHLLVLSLQSIFDKAAAENEVYSFYNWAYAPYPPMESTAAAAATATDTEMVPMGPLTGAALRRQATKKREEKRRLRDHMTRFNLVKSAPNGNNIRNCHFPTKKYLYRILPFPV